MSVHARLAALPVTVDGCRLEPLETAIRGDFVRATTVVRLTGDACEGVGEDVTYERPDHVAAWAHGSPELRGTSTLGELLERIAGLELFPGGPSRADSRAYRRWAFESAALDLALRQSGRSLAGALGRTPHPVRFVISPNLGRPPTAAPVLDLLDRRPEARFKLDPSPAWDDALVRRLADTSAVATLDFKGRYRGTPVDQPPDADLYRRVLPAFPRATIEDPHDDPAVAAVVAAHAGRVAWDAPLHAVEDLARLPFDATRINVKPSRVGSLRELLRLHEHAERHGLSRYAGGQFELGPGRGQAQVLAALFHPDADNDIAPLAYHRPAAARRLPASPLDPELDDVGFRWKADATGG